MCVRQVAEHNESWQQNLSRATRDSFVSLASFVCSVHCTRALHPFIRMKKKDTFPIYYFEDRPIPRLRRSAAAVARSYKCTASRYHLCSRLPPVLNSLFKLSG
eukprot:21227-Heterococcus_DN1.PRE.1